MAKKYIFFLNMILPGAPAAPRTARVFECLYKLLGVCSAHRGGCWQLLSGSSLNRLCLVQEDAAVAWVGPESLKQGSLRTVHLPLLPSMPSACSQTQAQGTSGKQFSSEIQDQGTDGRRDGTNGS